MVNLSLLVPILCLALFVQDGDSVLCFTCTSDLHPICDDPFPITGADAHNVVPLVNCDAGAPISYPYLTPTFKTVCKKLKKTVNGQQITARGCAWKPVTDKTNKCTPSSEDGAHVFTTFCETCDYDGCNGSGAAPADGITTEATTTIQS